MLERQKKGDKEREMKSYEEWASQRTSEEAKTEEEEELKNIHRYPKCVSEWVVLGYFSLQFNRIFVVVVIFVFVSLYALLPLSMSLFQQRE